MESPKIWLLKDWRYRWVHVTPMVVPTTSSRLKYSHRMHISLTIQSPSMPLCGQYQEGDYHPWPLLKTRAIADEDACTQCVQVLLRELPQAMGYAHRTLFLRGEIEEISPEPSFPPELAAQIGQMAALVGQQYQLLQEQGQIFFQWKQVFEQHGLVLPEALAALPAGSPSASDTQRIIPLMRYSDFRAWCAQHPRGYIVAIRSNMMKIHQVSCHYVTNQAESTYSVRLGSLTIEEIREEIGEDPEPCGDCLPSLRK